MIQERHNGEERPLTSASQSQQKKDKILLISGICIPIGLMLFGLASLLARTPTAGAGLMLFVLALLLFIGGSGILHYEACYKILEKTLTPSNVISFRNNMEQFARYLLGILAHSQESPT